MSRPIDFVQLWKWTVDQVKQQESAPTLFRALEAATPLALENDELVIGFGQKVSTQAGVLGDIRYRNAVERALEAGTRQRIKLRVIHGDTLEDWHHVQQAEEEARKLARRATEKRLGSAASGETWDGVADNLATQFSEHPHRNVTCGQSEFLEIAIQELASSYERLMPSEPGELEFRAYSRVLDRIAGRAGVQPALLGWLVLQRRTNQPKPDPG